MAKAKPLPISFTRIVAGIADYDKESILVDSVAFARQVDFRTNPRRWTILPKTSKESGTVITGLPMWGERISTDTYVYDDAGSIYKRTSGGSITFERSVANSSGNGLKYFPEDGFLYYTLDKVIGRYGRIGSSPSYTDDFLGAQGGVPTNTYALDLEAASSQYATAADSASLSQTGDIAMEINWKPESLPAAAGEMVLMSKWDELSDERSYKLSVNAISGYFGDGSGGALTISSNTTQTVIDSACSGTSGANSLSATNVSFTTDQIVLIIQMRGTGAGTWQRNKIVSYTAGTITLQDNLNFSYASGAQVLVLNQYSGVTINSGIVWTGKSWTQTVGGIFAFICNGTFTNNGTMRINGGDGSVVQLQNASGGRGTGGGFYGGHGRTDPGQGQGFQGEGTGGTGGQSSAANGSGGGGGDNNVAPGGNPGGGGGNGTAGNNGQTDATGSGSIAGYGGAAVGTADLTTMLMGSGGGGGGREETNNCGGGGAGGGIVFITSADIVIHASTGYIQANGGNGGNVSDRRSGGGGGAGGSILLKCQTATLNTTRITATGGSGDEGGEGGVGRIHIDYYTSYTGTTSPTIDAAQDNSLVTNLTYQLRLQVSQTGANEETYTKPLTSIVAGTNGHYAVSWDAATSTATFWENGVSLGTSTGAFTAIYNSTALFAIGASFNAAGAAENFLDGIVDDMRFWSAERTTAQIFNNKEVELGGTETGLQGYWQVDNSASDTTANANNLTLVNTPVYTTTVPFSAPTTRQDIDQEDTSTGQVYALTAAIDEGASHRQTFIPAKDPQKSIGIYVSDTGDDSNWIITVHDPQNRLIATSTVTHANLHTGHNEFEYTSTWRPVIGASYHFHITATTTTGAPAVVTGTASNLETAEFKSYYQFLVEDAFHPIEQVLNQLAIGNERYVATYDASTLTYNPHRLTFPSGWRVRCIAKWGEYWAFGCWKGTTVSDYDQGIIFFWDGYSDTYNFFREVPEGAINAMLGSQGTLYIVAGYQGDILEFTGGEKATKVKRIPKITDDKYVEVLPGAMSMWRTLLQIGVGVTDSSEIEQGVYSWGKRNNSYVDALSFDYKISTGTIQSTGVKIGLVMPVNKKLLIGWKDNVSFGLDSVDPAGDPYSEGSIEWLIRDEGGIWKEKKVDTIRADFEALASGESVSLQHKLDRASAWSTEEEEDTDDEVKLRWQPTFTRHNEYQVRLNLKTTGSTSPAALGVTIMEDALTDEEYV